MNLKLQRCVMSNLLWVWGSSNNGEEVQNGAMKFLWIERFLITSSPWLHCCLADTRIVIGCLYLYCSKTGVEWLQTMEAQDVRPNSSLSWRQLPSQDWLTSWLKSCSLTSALHLYQCLYHTVLESPWTVIPQKWPTWVFLQMSKCPELWFGVSFWGFELFAKCHSIGGINRSSISSRGTLHPCFQFHKSQWRILKSNSGP